MTDIPRQHRHRRLITGALVLGAVVLLLWTAALMAYVRPAERPVDWKLLWSGFDLLEAAAMGGAAWLVHRGDHRASLLMTALATLMVTDAWFDVMTAPADYFPVSVVMALALELPLAVAFALIALRLHRAAPAPEAAWQERSAGVR